MIGMFSKTMIILFSCFLIANTSAVEHCPGEDDLPWKLNGSSIVVYGNVTEMNGNTITLKITCILRGPFIESTIRLNQVSNVNDRNECHYLTTDKDYIVFLQPSKSVISQAKNSDELINLEEIEVNSNSLAKFLDDECSDEDDYGIPMTITYTQVNRKCGKFQAIRNENTKTSILNLNSSSLIKSSTFIGGIKYPLGIPKMDESEHEMVSGKHRMPTSNESFRASATTAMPFVSLTLFLTCLIIMFND